MFQETHSTEDTELAYKSDFKGKVLFSHGRVNCRGVLLGFRPGLQVEVISEVSDPDGRYIVANVCIWGEPITLVVTYLEPSMTMPLLENTMQKIVDAIDSFENSRIIFGGDFNSVLDPRLDSNAPSHTADFRGTKLQKFIDENDFTDVWQAIHPQERHYTCFRNGHRLSRIDYFLASPVMMTHVCDSKIGVAYRSDHTPMYLDFTLHENEIGKGIWRLPNYLLGNSEYRTLVQNLIQELKERNVEADPEILWDTIKACIRGETITFLTKEKRIKKQTIEKLEIEIFQAV